MIVNARSGEITLEEIMQHGDEELPVLEEFLPLWVRCRNPWERIGIPVLQSEEALQKLGKLTHCAYGATPAPAHESVWTRL